MKRTTLLKRMGALGLAVMLLAGCTSGAQTNTENNQNSETDQSAQVKTEGNLPVDENGKVSQFGRYSEPVTLKIAQIVNPTIAFPEGQTATDNAIFDYLKEKMNIDIEVMWQAGSNEDYNEKLNLAISSGELPDVFSVDGSQLKMLVSAGMLEDISEVYDFYASDRIKMSIDSTEGKSMEAVTFDGKMMAMPNVKAMKDGYDLLWIRQDWLDQLGLEAPKTIDDIRNIAKQFVQNKMGGEKTVGLLGPSSGSSLYSNFLKSSAAMGGFGGVF